jgi:glycosyltransferase involved in cell wall biosynthesis
MTYDVGYMRAIMRSSDMILAVTAAEKAFIQRQGWNPNVVVGGNSLRLEHFPPLEREKGRAYFGLPLEGFVLLFLGRKTDYKGLDICLKAFIKLRQQRDDVYFLALGPETEYSQQLWKAHESLAGLIVHGRVSDEERLAALATCDVLLLPSTGEAFGIVYLEAWAYHKPVIGARIPSVSSLISDGKDGLLIEPGDSEALLKHVEQLMNEPVLAQTLAANGNRKLKRRYTIERIGDIIEGTYARVLRRRGTKRGGQ